MLLCWFRHDVDLSSSGGGGWEMGEWWGDEKGRKKSAPAGKKSVITRNAAYDTHTHVRHDVLWKLPPDKTTLHSPHYNIPQINRRFDTLGVCCRQSNKQQAHLPCCFHHSLLPANPPFADSAALECRKKLQTPCHFHSLID